MFRLVFLIEKWGNKVCMLNKSLYQLKQSLRAQFRKFTKSMVRRGCKQSQSNHTLKKSLYRLKQSLRAQFGKFTKSIVRRGCKQSQSNHTLFIKHSTHGKVSALIVYVNDIVVTRDDLIEIGKLKYYLVDEFKSKDLGSLRYFLGIEVARSKRGTLIS